MTQLYWSKRPRLVRCSLKSSRRSGQDKIVQTGRRQSGGRRSRSQKTATKAAGCCGRPSRRGHPACFAWADGRLLAQQCRCHVYRYLGYRVVRGGTASSMVTMGFWCIEKLQRCQQDVLGSSCQYLYVSSTGTQKGLQRDLFRGGLRIWHESTWVC
jgi:hypothetical protein